MASGPRRGAALGVGFIDQLLQPFVHCRQDVYFSVLLVVFVNVVPRNVLSSCSAPPSCSTQYCWSTKCCQLADKNSAMSSESLCISGSGLAMFPTVVFAKVTTVNLAKTTVVEPLSSWLVNTLWQCDTNIELSTYSILFSCLRDFLYSDDDRNILNRELTLLATAMGRDKSWSASLIFLSLFPSVYVHSFQLAQQLFLYTGTAPWTGRCMRPWRSVGCSYAVLPVRSEAGQARPGCHQPSHHVWSQRTSAHCAVITKMIDILCLEICALCCRRLFCTHTASSLRSDNRLKTDRARICPTQMGGN